jgi:hypothetical protein
MNSASEGKSSGLELGPFLSGGGTRWTMYNNCIYPQHVTISTLIDGLALSLIINGRRGSRSLQRRLLLGCRLLALPRSVLRLSNLLVPGPE